jgi:hypothetical protein
MYWKTATPNLFNPKDINDFAKKNGCQLIDSVELQSDSIKNWQYEEKSIFPLSHTGLSTPTANISTYQYFPRWINSQIKIYGFKTGWIAIEPGTDISIEKNGFVVINQNGTEISVYHLWGE